MAKESKTTITGLPAYLYLWLAAVMISLSIMRMSVIRIADATERIATALEQANEPKEK